MGLRAAHGKTDEYTEKVADSLHYRLEAPKIASPIHQQNSAPARSRVFIVFMNRLRSSRPLSFSWGLRIWLAPFSGSTASTRLNPSSS